MYHILLFVAMALTFVFLWVLQDYDARVWQYGQLYAFVTVFLFAGLVWLAEKVSQKPSEQSDSKDFYLVSQRDGDTISYRVENEEKETVMEAVGNIDQGRLVSIELFQGVPAVGSAYQVIQKNSTKGYSVREGETVVGTIRERKDGLDYRDAEGRVISSADFTIGSVGEEEESVADILDIVTLTPRESRGKADILLIKDPAGGTAGMYYYALRNLELALEGSRAIDWHIAAVLAIMADAELQLAN